jgi:hypothetical protein
MQGKLACHPKQITGLEKDFPLISVAKSVQGVTVVNMRVFRVAERACQQVVEHFNREHVDQEAERNQARHEASNARFQDALRRLDLGKDGGRIKRWLKQVPPEDASSDADPEEEESSIPEPVPSHPSAESEPPAGPDSVSVVMSSEHLFFTAPSRRSTQQESGVVSFETGNPASVQQLSQVSQDGEK